MRSLSKIALSFRFVFRPALLVKGATQIFGRHAIARTNFYGIIPAVAKVAQLVEQLTRNEQVVSSSLILGSVKKIFLARYYGEKKFFLLKSSFSLTIARGAFFVVVLALVLWYNIEAEVHKLFAL